MNGVSLAEAKIPGCGTCGTFLWAGYGDGLVNEEDCMAVRDQIKIQKLGEIPWGRVPDEYRTAQFNDYPDMSLLTRISELPSDRIRALIESEMKKGKDMHTIKLLRTYAALFPEGKWLSTSEQAWLAREDQEFNPTEIWGAPV